MDDCERAWRPGPRGWRPRYAGQCASYHTRRAVAVAARARKVTSGSRRPEGGPERVGRRGVPARPRPSGRSSRRGRGQRVGVALHFRSPHLFIFIKWAWAGPVSWPRPAPGIAPHPRDPAPAEARAPVGRPWLPPLGGSFHLVQTQKCVALVPPPLRPYPVRRVSSLGRQEGLARAGGGFSPDRSVGMWDWPRGLNPVLIN